MLPPFDLIAALLCLEAVARYLAVAPRLRETALLPLGWAFAAWGAFLVVTWLLHELVTRDAEWRTRFGYHVAGFGGRRHPLIMHTWSVRIAQALTVLLYAGALWLFRWPLWVAKWPAALGMDPEATIGALPLAESATITIPLDLLPFLLAMVVSWIPRRRLAERLQGRSIPLRAYLGHEVRLRWLPVVIGLLLAAVRDIGAMLPARYTTWMEEPGVDLLLVVAFLMLTSLVILPKLIVWWWQCKPLPDGELRQRLLALMRRSGVSAREIMVWGPRGSGFLNAAVLGGWARFRYVLISPALVDELGVEETEAVLGHELGHVRYGHLIFLFMMILCLSALLGPVIEALPEPWRQSPLIEVTVAMSFIGAFMFFFYGMIMRQCEREADLASAELLGTSVPLVAALEKLALRTGNIRSVWCWHHGSIAQRVAAVQQLSRDPEASRRFHAWLRRVRVLFIVLTVVALATQLLTRLL